MKLWKTGLVSLSLVSLANPAFAACATPRDAAALKTAALQQRLMVAALTCHASDAYNRFVTAYRPELQRSDADLKNFFIKNGGEHGEAGYDTYKTKMANLSAYGEATNAAGFCAGAEREFAAIFRNGRSLDEFVAGEPLAVKDACAEPALAAEVRPVLPAIPSARVAQAKPVRLASNDVVVGVPSHAMPAMPYGTDVAPPAPPPVAAAPVVTAAPYAESQARNADQEEDAPLPPRRSRAMRRQMEDDNYAPDDDYVPDQDYVPPPPRYSYYEIRHQAPPQWYRDLYQQPLPDYYARN